MNSQAHSASLPSVNSLTLNANVWVGSRPLWLMTKEHRAPWSNRSSWFCPQLGGRGREPQQSWCLSWVSFSIVLCKFLSNLRTHCVASSISILLTLLVSNGSQGAVMRRRRGHLGDVCSEMVRCPLAPCRVVTKASGHECRSQGSVCKADAHPS